MAKVRENTMAVTIVESIKKLGVTPTPKLVRAVASATLLSLGEKWRGCLPGRLQEAAELDPEAVQGALEDSIGQLAALQDFLNPENMQRFEAASEFVPQLEEFFNSLNMHFELQKQKEEEAAEEAEASAEQAEQEAADEAEKQAAAQEAEAEEQGETPEAQAEEGAGIGDSEEAEAAEDESGELAESLARWKQLAGIIRG